MFILFKLLLLWISKIFIIICNFFCLKMYIKIYINKMAKHIGACCCLVANLCLTLREPLDCSLPGSSVHGILQARILEQVAMLSSRGSSRPRDWQASPVSPVLAGKFFITVPPGKPHISAYRAIIFILTIKIWRYLMTWKFHGYLLN